MLGKLRKLKGRSVDELRERAMQAIVARTERYGFGNSAGELSDARLQSLLGSHAATRGETPADALYRQFTDRAPLPMFVGIRDGSSANEYASERWATAGSALKAQADNVLQGKFDLLGYCALEFGSPINWHTDPVSKHVAPLLHWSRISYLDADKFGDHKVIWELNRHQHFQTLGRAYQLTGDEQYAHCFAQHITSWMTANPPKLGINWASSLEIAYRSIAWIWALEFFRKSQSLTPALLLRITKFAYLHGRHLERYLSTYFSPNTHLTGEALGLLYLGSAFPDLRCASRWRERGWAILVNQVARQIHADGVYFEQTTYYHRYTLDIYLHALLLAAGNGWEIPKAVTERVTVLAKCLRDMTGPDGMVPLIGDDDGGQLVSLETRDARDTRAALAIAAVVLNRADLGASVADVSEEVLWTLGAAGVAAAEINAHATPAAPKSVIFAEGGYAVLRDLWNSHAMHAIVDCGPLGTLNCGHAHADSLSMVCSAGGGEIFVDPGTYSYTTSAVDRDLFRHSALHNTVTIDGESSSVPAGPFSWKYRTDARLVQWWSGTLVDRVVALHNGFMRLPVRTTHRRTVVFVRRGYWVVIDHLSPKTDCEIVAHWHCAPLLVTNTLPSDQTLITSEANRKNHETLFATFGTIDEVKWSESWISPKYGVRELAPHAAAISRGAGRRDMIAVIAPVREQQKPIITSLPASGGYAIEVTTSEGTDLLLIAQGEFMETGSISFRGDTALLRRASTGDPTGVAMFGANAVLQSPTVNAESRGPFEAALSEASWHEKGDGTLSLVTV